MKDPSQGIASRGSVRFGWLRPLIALAVASSACSVGSSRDAAAEQVDSQEGRDAPAADSIALSREVCRQLASRQIGDSLRVEVPEFTMKRDRRTGELVGRGGAIAQSPNGAVVTHRFVCVVDPSRSGGGTVVLETFTPDTYREMVQDLAL